MLIRLPLAFVVGLVVYMVAMAMTVYDGILSLIFQPIMGSILTAVALVALCVIGSPLLIGRLWRIWSRIGWLALLIPLAGVVACSASWHPVFRIKVLDPETGAMIDSFHPVLAIVGWLVLMFGLAFCPVIGFRGDRRWI